MVAPSRRYLKIWGRGPFCFYKECRVVPAISACIPEAGSILEKMEQSNSMNNAALIGNTSSHEHYHVVIPPWTAPEPRHRKDSLPSKPSVPHHEGSMWHLPGEHMAQPFFSTSVTNSISKAWTRARFKCTGCLSNKTLSPMLAPGSGQRGGGAT